MSGMSDRRISISWPTGSVTATLDDTPTADQLWAALPLESTASTWGDEAYFRLPFDADEEPNATAVVEPGTVCFWLAGSSLALPYGPTPISTADECRLASECNILGKLEGDPRTLATIHPSDPVTVTKS
jgi:hypothetical protein